MVIIFQVLVNNKSEMQRIEMPILFDKAYSKNISFPGVIHLLYTFGNIKVYVLGKSRSLQPHVATVRGSQLHGTRSKHGHMTCLLPMPCTHFNV